MEKNEIIHSLSTSDKENTSLVKICDYGREKNGETVPIILEEGKCQFILKKKKRQCRLTPMKGEVYCGEHIIHSYKQNGNQLDVPTDINKQIGIEHTASDEKTVNVGIKRVRCPLDPKHTVSESRLAKHLKICNSRDPVELSYFRKGVNKLPLLKSMGSQQLASEFAICATESCQTDYNGSSSEAVETVDPSTKSYSTAPSFDEVSLVVNKLQEILKSITGHEEDSIEACELPDEFRHHPKVCLEASEIDPNSKKGKEAQRHVTQIGSLLRKLEIEGYFGDSNSESDLRDRVFVEMGAGRGQLSYWASVVTDKRLPILLVDNANVKNKFDHHYKYDSPHLYHRINMDIQHLSLSGIPFLKNLRGHVRATETESPKFATDGGKLDSFGETFQVNTGQLEQINRLQNHNSDSVHQTESNTELRMIMVTKHLCGAATDFAITCASNYAQNLASSNESGQKINNLFSHNYMPDLLLTFCCHHRCSWESYVGKDFFIEHGLSGHEFKVMSRISAWYTCGDKWHAEHTNSTLSSADSSESIDSMLLDSTNSSLTKKKNEEKVHHSDSIEFKQQIETQGKISFTAEEKERIGKQCKFLINYGRLKYLEKYHGMKCRMYNYVPSSVTLENVALLAQINN